MAQSAAQTTAQTTGSETGRTALILACGALVREIRTVFAALPGAEDSVHVEYLPAPLHNRPEKITPAIAERLKGEHSRYRRIVLGYGDCGTGGHLDAFMAQWNSEHPQTPVSRIPGDHCYAFFNGLDNFAALHEEELGTLFLTDYLVRHFDLLIWQGLGLADHPELRDLYFGNYKRVVYIAQTHNPELVAMATESAHRLGLAYEFRYTGMAPFSDELMAAVQWGSN